jgi:hypothetical protein
MLKDGSRVLHDISEKPMLSPPNSEPNSVDTGRTVLHASITKGDAAIG